MHLLDQNEQKTDKQQSEEAIKERIRKLLKLEKSLIEGINELREQSENEKNTINEDLRLVRSEAELETKKSVLLQEVRVLEERKEKSLLPINQLEKEAKQKMEEATRTLGICNIQVGKIVESEKKLAEREKAIDQQENEANKRDLSLDKREIGISASESEIKRQESSLAQKWVEFTTSCAAFDQDLYEKTEDLEKREEMLVTRQKQQDERENEQDDRERGLQDRYATLERAIREKT